MKTTTNPRRAKLLEGAEALRDWVIRGSSNKLRNIGFAFEGDELTLPHGIDLQPTGRQCRAQSVALETGGGEAVADEFAGTMDVQAKFLAAVRQYATVVTMETGGPMLYPIVQDFDNEGVVIPKNYLMPENDIEQFGQVKFNSQEIGSKWLVIPIELLEDAPLALMVFLARVLGERCGRGANRLYSNTLIGSNQAGGMIPTGITTANASAIAGDELIDGSHSRPD